VTDRNGKSRPDISRIPRNGKRMLGLPLVGLHIELEREIRRILPGGEGRPIALSEAIRRMAGEGLELDQIVRILPVIYLANRAAHGLDNDPVAAVRPRSRG
jgi:hypothetical protein